LYLPFDFSQQIHTNQEEIYLKEIKNIRKITNNTIIRIKNIHLNNNK